MKRFRPPEGRNRIDPNKPYGHWASGWYPAALPPKKQEKEKNDGRKYFGKAEKHCLQRRG